MKPHKHAEVIKAWADGAEVQSRTYRDSEWILCPFPAWSDDVEYRIKPAAPKWPQTTMTYKQMEAAYLIAGDLSSWNSAAAIFLANAAIAHACETGQVVTSDQYNERIKSHEELVIALRDGARRERELGEALHTAIMNPSYTEERDIAIAINVRVACLVKHPGVLSNDELNKIIATVK